MVLFTWGTAFSSVYLFGLLEGENGRFAGRRGLKLPVPLPLPKRMERLLMAARGGVGSTNRAWDREKPCLVSENPWAVLGDILVGGYLLEVNSTRGLRFNANEAKVIQGPAGSLLFPLCRAPLSAARPLTDAGGGGTAWAGSFSQTDGSPAVCADG